MNLKPFFLCKILRILFDIWMIIQDKLKIYKLSANFASNKLTNALSIVPLLFKIIAR